MVSREPNASSQGGSAEGPCSWNRVGALTCVFVYMRVTMVTRDCVSENKSMYSVFNIMVCIFYSKQMNNKCMNMKEP